MLYRHTEKTTSFYSLDRRSFDEELTYLGPAWVAGDRLHLLTAICLAYLCVRNRGFLHRYFDGYVMCCLLLLGVSVVNSRCCQSPHPTPPRL